MKKSLVFFVGLIFGILILGIAILKSSVLILSIPLIVFLFSAIANRPEENRILIRREIFPQQSLPGKDITVHLFVKNQGRAVEELSIEDLLPEGIQVNEGNPDLITSLGQNDSVEIVYCIEAQRGHYKHFETAVRARDFSGFFEAPVSYSTTIPLMVKPRYPQLERIKTRPPQTRGFAGPINARQGGTGIDFFGVREYQSGDPQRQLNWKIAARHKDQLFTNIFEQERVADVGIILDARRSMDVTVPSDSLFEYSVRAAAALVEYFLKEGNRVSLVVYGGSIANIYPGYGRIHQDRILKTLAKAQPGHNYALENLALLPTRLFPAKSQIVIISPLSTQDIPIFVTLRARGYAIMVISPDPVSFEADSYHDHNSLAYRMAFAERTLLLQHMQRSGIQVVNWRIDQPLDVALRNQLSHHHLIYQPIRSGI